MSNNPTTKARPWDVEAAKASLAETSKLWAKLSDIKPGDVVSFNAHPFKAQEDRAAPITAG